MLQSGNSEFPVLRSISSVDGIDCPGKVWAEAKMPTWAEYKFFSKAANFLN